MSTTPEGKVKLALKKMLREEFPQVWTYWPVSNGMGAHGIPDLIMCAGGMFIGAEVKAPGKKVTLLQANQLQQIENAQGTPMILVGDEAVATLRAYLSCLHLPRAPDTPMAPTFHARVTQAEYDALPVKDPQTIYSIVD
jgi:hypothetical protein